MASANDSESQREQERENANREFKDPASKGFDKKLNGLNRPAE